MDMDHKIKWATELIEEKLKLEEEQQQKKHSSVMPREVVRLNIPHLEKEKKHEPLNKDIASLKGQEKVRKSSVDLRKEILEVGGTEYFFKLHKKPKKEKKPEPEQEEITGPVAMEDFLKAAVQGRVQVVEKFLVDGGSPDTCDEFHRTALHRASLEGYTEIVEKLLDRGATIDFRDRLDCTALHWACRGGHLAVVKLLQEKGANLKLKDKEGDSALHDAVRLNRYKIIKMLILYGADMLAKNLAGKTPADLVQLWQADTREVLEKKEPITAEMPT
ncbi:ankyrin repeat domain-containing protein 2 isoform 3-T3 [Vipera latastei]